MSGNPWKTASFIQVIALAALLAIGWMNFEARFRTLEKRVGQLEAESRTLAPLSQVMRGYQPGRATPRGYEAVQATGPANVAKPGMDSALAWCPATEDRGAEWIELRYAQPVSTAEVRIFASFNPGAVVRVLGGTDAGNLRELWAGSGSLEAIQKLAIAPVAEISVVKLELDTAKVPGWNQIDAVALVDAAGVTHYANDATSSSHWGETKPPALRSE